MNYESIEIPGAPRSSQAFLPSSATPGQLVNAVVDNHARWFAAKSLALGGEARPAPGGGILAISPHEITLAFPRVREANSGQYVDEFMVLCRERRPDLVGCWARDPRGYGTLGCHLAARGFEWRWQAQWMALDLRAIRSDFPTPPGLRIEVDEHADWEVEDLPYYDKRELGALRALGAARPRRIWHFGAWLDGKPVGHSLLHLSTGRFGVGGIYNVGVIPDAQNQGIGRAVSLAACYAARKLSANYAVLNAATHIYDRIGFKTVGRGQTWWLERERLLHPPSAEEIAFAEAIGTGDLSALEHASRLPDLDAPLACGLTPIRFAARYRKPASARWLASRGAPLRFLDAWDLGWKREAVRLLKKQPELANLRSGRWQMTPLHVAAERGDEELARLILTAKPDLTLCDGEFNGTALGWARHFNQAGVAALIAGAE